MASQYSILREYKPFVSPYNTELLAKGMEYMQGKVDTNRQAINDYADYIINSDIAKPQDREYLQDKLNSLISDVNNVYRKSNLASDGVARSIQSRLGNALDDRTLNAIAGTREGRKMRDKLEDMKMNNPKMYSSVNEAAAMKPYYDWENDGKVGSRLDPLHYTPYTDYRAEVEQKFKDLTAINKGKKIYEPLVDANGNRTGEMVATTIDERGVAETMNLAKSLISPNAKAQMQIEGWYMASTNPDMFTQGSFSNMLSGYASEFDMREKAIMAELAGVGDDKRKKLLLENNINNIRLEKQAFMDNASSMMGDKFDPSRAGSFVVEQEFLRGVGNAWSYNNTSIERKKDDYFYAESDRMFKNQEFAWKMQDAKEKNRIAEIRAMRSGKGSGSGSGGDGTVPAEAWTGVGITGVADLKKEDPFRVLQERVSTNSSSMRVGMDNLWNSISGTGKRSIESLMSSRQDYSGMNRGDAIMKYFFENGGANSDYLNNDKSQKYYADIVRLANDKNIFSSLLTDIDKTYKDILGSDNSKSIIGGVAQSSGRVPVFNGDKVVYGEDLYAKGNGVNINGKELSNDDVSMLSALASKFSSAMYKPTTSIQELINTGASSREGNMSDLPMVLNMMNDIIGGSLSMSDIFTPGEGSHGFNQNKTGNKANDFILGAINAMVNGQSSLGRNNYDVWNNSHSVSSLFDDASKESKKLATDYYDQFAPMGYSFNEKAPAKSPELKLYTSLYTIFNKGGGKLDKQEGDHVMSVVKVGDKSYISADGKEDIGDMVEVSDKDLEGINYRAYERGHSIPSKLFKTRDIPISFASPSNIAYQEAMEDGFGLGATVTSDDAKDTLHRSYMGAYGSWGMSDEIGKYINGLVDNASKFVLRAEGYEDFNGVPGVRVNLFPRSSTGGEDARPLYSYKIPGQEFADSISQRINLAPQSFFVDMISSMLNEDMTRRASYANPSSRGLPSNMTDVLRVIQGDMSEDGQ